MSCHLNSDDPVELRMWCDGGGQSSNLRVNIISEKKVRGLDQLKPVY